MLMKRRTILILGSILGFCISPASALAQSTLNDGAPGGGEAGTLIVLNKAQATASLIDLTTGDEIMQLPTGDSPHEAAVSPDGTTVVVANYGGQQPGNSLTVIDLAERRVVRTISLGEYHRPHGLAFLPDGRLLVTAETERNLLIVDLNAADVDGGGGDGGGVVAIATDQSGSHMVAATPDGTRAFVANIGSGSMAAIDLATNTVIDTIQTGGGAEGIDVTPDGRELWVSNRAGDTVTVLNTRTLTVLATLDSPAFPIRVKITPDGRHALVSNARSGDVTVFDCATRERVALISMGGDDVVGEPTPVGILIPPAGQFAYVANTRANFVTVIDLATWQIVGRLVAGQEPDGMAWSLIEVGKPGDEQAEPDVVSP
jgi:YVTN family beta-propeller protein